MTELTLSPDRRRLTEAEKSQYREWGYVRNLPVFDTAAVAALQDGFQRLAARLPAEIDLNKVNMWHKASRWYHDVCRTPAILDYVEDLIGPDFYQWGGQFFVKYPGDNALVPWHQDAQYWPLTPRKTVTVWLAVYDADESNGAMQVVRGSHRHGEFQHHRVSGDEYVLEQEVDQDQIDRERIVTLSLNAGEISLHDDGLLHGSGPNNSERTRCGLTMRFSPYEVKCDRRVWPTFEAYPARGIDKFGHNPIGPLPTGEHFPVRKFQHSSEFQ